MNIINDRITIKDFSNTGILIFNMHNWNLQNSKPLRKWDSIFLKNNLKEEIISDVRMYIKLIKKMSKFENAGRRVYMFHGPPGTGKTSISLAIAAELKSAIFKINANEICDSALGQALNTAKMTNGDIPPVFLLEDLDELFIEGDNGVAGVMAAMPGMSPHMAMPKLTYSGVLNAIDGSDAPNDALFILTSNRATSYDDALLRRVNKHWYIAGTDEKSVGDHMAHFRKLWDPDFIVSAEEQKIVGEINKNMNEKNYQMHVLRDCIINAAYKVAEKDIDADPTYKDIFDEINNYDPLMKPTLSKKNINPLTY